MGLSKFIKLLRSIFYAEVLSINFANISISFKKLEMRRIKPGTAGSMSKFSGHCAMPTSTVLKFIGLIFKFFGPQHEHHNPCIHFVFDLFTSVSFLSSY